MSDPINTREIFDRLIETATKIGSIEARQTSVENRISVMEQTVKEALEKIEQSYDTIDGKMDDLIKTQEGLKGQIAGGWKVLTMLGAAAVFFGGLFSWLYDRWESIKSAVF